MENLFYAAKIPNVKYVSSKASIYTETGKYAYIISGSTNSMGDSDLSLLMGYDEQKRGMATICKSNKLL